MLNRNAKLYGPMNALDIENSSTCWNSEGTRNTETKQQWIQVEFPGRIVRPCAVSVQFQAGFSCETCRIQFLEEDKTKTSPSGSLFKLVGQEDLSFEDDHSLQRYDLTMPENCSAIRFVCFDNFSDLYGRVIIYQLQVWGLDTEETEEKP